MTNKFNSFSVKLIAVFFLLTLFVVGDSCNGKSGKKGDNNSDSGMNKNPEGETSAITYVRKNANTPAAQADLDAMEAAMKIMKRDLKCDNTSSWYYQGGIHWVPSTIPNGNPLCPSYTNLSQLKTAWRNCTHGPGSEMHFLIWHRLYIWYFEKIVRKLSGKKDFALPYWAYVNTNDRVMPSIFRNTSDSLYESERITSLNTGQPIDPSFAQEFLVDAMQLNNQNTDYESFNSNIDAAPHGAMHGYIGNATNPYNRIFMANRGGLMGQVPSAAFDPVFWVHHANIDYLWTVWDTTANGARPILSELEKFNQPYVFFDENGNKVTYTIAQALDKAFNLDYRYDVMPPVVTKAKPPAPQNKTELMSMNLNESINKAQRPVLVKVDDKVRNMLESIDDTKKSYILEITVSYKTAPKDAYTVYIDTDRPDPKKKAGFMTFFGAEEMINMPGMESSQKFTYNITGEFNLNAIGDNLKLLIVNASGKPANDITISKIRIETRNL
jgi:Common central domain of tyrosinase/Polyphenol oxidase middle domain